MDRRYARSWVAIVLFLIAYLIFSALRRCESSRYQYDEGVIFGTFYHITYRSPESLAEEIKQQLLRFDASLSPFNDTSLISRVNRNEPVETDRWFRHVFMAAQQIYARTGGAFDPTVSPLVNAWGFGFKEGAFPDSTQVDSLLSHVGMDKLSLHGKKVLKSDTAVTLNFSAIAKGYACDVIGQMLSDRGVDDFMVEIGGEVVVRGRNPEGKAWRVGVNRPTIADGEAGTIEEILQLTGGGLATSGNYRNYRVVDGKRIVHTIDPATGYPVQHSLLSATVLAPDCMTADAYATAFMVMGLERSRALVDSLPGIEALFLYQNPVDTARIDYWVTPGMQALILGN